MTSPCPVCSTHLVQDAHVQLDRYFYECLRCGPFSLNYEANTDLHFWMGKYEDASARLSYAINKITSRQTWALISTDQLKDILTSTQLPSPQEQLEILILWVGEMQKRPGMRVRPDLDLIARVGATNFADLHFIIRHAIDSVAMVRGDINGSDQEIDPSSVLHLSFAGWAFYEELKRGHGASQIAFMAMQFNDAELDAVFKDYFEPAVAATGFKLRRIDDGQAAGLIDDKLRVAIRQARFIVADLTHQNRGAYWEAGYAEGLGKPVIYTCRKDIFEDKNQGTHFDTNHHLTVVWEPGKLEKAAARLKDTIRATLPEDAKQEA